MKLCSKGILIIGVMIGILAGSLLLSGSMNEASARSVVVNYDISGFITPVEGLSSVYFIGSYPTYSGDTGYFFNILNDTPFIAGEITPFSFTTGYDDGYAPSSYTILAIHDLENDGVTVGSNAIEPGTSWDSLYGTQYTQQTFAALLVGSYIGGYLMEFYANNTGTLGAPMGSNLSLVNFSDATHGGSAHASAVPLPATFFLLAPGLLGLAALRRGKRG